MTHLDPELVLVELMTQSGRGGRITTKTLALALSASPHVVATAVATLADRRLVDAERMRLTMTGLALAAAARASYRRARTASTAVGLVAAVSDAA